MDEKEILDEPLQKPVQGPEEKAFGKVKKEKKGLDYGKGEKELVDYIDFRDVEMPVRPSENSDAPTWTTQQQDSWDKWEHDEDRMARERENLAKEKKICDETDTRVKQKLADWYSAPARNEDDLFTETKTLNQLQNEQLNLIDEARKNFQDAVHTEVFGNGLDKYFHTIKKNEDGKLEPVFKSGLSDKDKLEAQKLIKVALERLQPVTKTLNEANQSYQDFIEQHIDKQITQEESDIISRGPYLGDIERNKVTKLGVSKELYEERERMLFDQGMGPQDWYNSGKRDNNLKTLQDLIVRARTPTELQGWVDTLTNGVGKFYNGTLGLVFSWTDLIGMTNGEWRWENVDDYVKNAHLVGNNPHLRELAMDLGRAESESLFDSQQMKTLNDITENVGEMGSFILALSLTGGLGNMSKLATESGKLAEGLSWMNFFKKSLNPKNFSEGLLKGTYLKGGITGVWKTYPDYMHEAIEDFKKKKNTDAVDWFQLLAMPVMKSAMEGMSETVGTHFLGSLFEKGTVKYLEFLLGKNGNELAKTVSSKVGMYFAQQFGEVSEERVNDLLDLPWVIAGDIKNDKGEPITREQYIKDKLNQSAYEFLTFIGSSALFTAAIGPNVVYQKYKDYATANFEDHLKEKFNMPDDVATAWFNYLRKEDAPLRKLKEVFNEKYQEIEQEVIRDFGIRQEELVEKQDFIEERARERVVTDDFNYLRAKFDDSGFTAAIEELKQSNPELEGFNFDSLVGEKDIEQKKSELIDLMQEQAKIKPTNNDETNKKYHAIRAKEIIIQRQKELLIANNDFSTGVKFTTGDLLGNEYKEGDTAKAWEVLNSDRDTSLTIDQEILKWASDYLIDNDLSIHAYGKNSDPYTNGNSTHAFVDKNGDIHLNVDGRYIKGSVSPTGTIIHEVVHKHTQTQLKNDKELRDRVISFKNAFLEHYKKEIVSDKQWDLIKIIEQTPYENQEQNDVHQAGEFLSLVFESRAFGRLLEKMPEVEAKTSFWTKLLDSFLSLIPLLRLKPRVNAYNELKAIVLNDFSGLSQIGQGETLFKKDSFEEMFDRSIQDQINEQEKENERILLDMAKGSVEQVDVIESLQNVLSGQEDSKILSDAENAELEEIEEDDSKLYSMLSEIQDNKFGFVKTSEELAMFIAELKNLPHQEGYTAFYNKVMDSFDPARKEEFQRWLEKRDKDILLETNGARTYLEHIYAMGISLEKVPYVVISQKKDSKGKLIHHFDIEKPTKSFKDAEGNNKTLYGRKKIWQQLVEQLEQQKGIKLEVYEVAVFDNQGTRTGEFGKVKFPTGAFDKTSNFTYKLIEQGYAPIFTGGSVLIVNIGNMQKKNESGVYEPIDQLYRTGLIRNPFNANFAVNPLINFKEGWKTMIKSPLFKHIIANALEVDKETGKSEKRQAWGMNDLMDEAYPNPNFKYGQMTVAQFIREATQPNFGENLQDRRVTYKDVEEHLEPAEYEIYKNSTPEQQEKMLWNKGRTYLSNTTIKTVIADYIATYVQREMYFGNILDGFKKEIDILKRGTAGNGYASKAFVSQSITNELKDKRKETDPMWMENGKPMIRAVILDESTLPSNIKKGLAIGDGSSFIIPHGAKIRDDLTGTPTIKRGLVAKFKIFNLQNLYKQGQHLAVKDSPMIKWMQQNHIGEIHLTSAIKIGKDKLVTDTVTYDDIINNKKVNQGQTYERDLTENAWIQDGGKVKKNAGGLLPVLVRTFLTGMIKNSSTFLNEFQKNIAEFQNIIETIGNDSEKLRKEILNFAKRNSFDSTTKKFIVKFFSSPEMRFLSRMPAVKDYFVNGVFSNRMKDLFKFKSKGAYPALTPDMGKLTDYQGYLVRNKQMSEEESAKYFTDGFINEGYCLLDFATMKKFKLKKGSKIFWVCNPAAGIQDIKPITIIGVLPGAGAMVVNNKQAQEISGKDYDFDKVPIFPVTSKAMLDLWNELKSAKLEDTYTEAVDDWLKDISDTKVQNVLEKLNYNRKEKFDKTLISKETVKLIELFGLSDTASKSIDLHNPRVMRALNTMLDSSPIGIVYNGGVKATAVLEIANKRLENADRESDIMYIPYATGPANLDTEFVEINLADFKKNLKANIALLNYLTHHALDWKTNPNILLYKFTPDKLTQIIFGLKSEAEGKIANEYFNQYFMPMRAVVQDPKNIKSSIGSLWVALQQATDAKNLSLNPFAETTFGKIVEMLEQINLGRLEVKIGDSGIFQNAFNAALGTVSEYATKHASNLIKVVRANALLNRIMFSTKETKETEERVNSKGVVTNIFWGFDNLRNLQELQSLAFEMKNMFGLSKNYYGELVKTMLAKELYVANPSIERKIYTKYFGTIKKSRTGDGISIKTEGTGAEYTFGIDENDKLAIRYRYYDNGNKVIEQEPMSFKQLYSSDQHKGALDKIILSGFDEKGWRDGDPGAQFVSWLFGPKKGLLKFTRTNDSYKITNDLVMEAFKEIVNSNRFQKEFTEEDRQTFFYNIFGVNDEPEINSPGAKTFGLRNLNLGLTLKGSKIKSNVDYVALSQEEALSKDYDPNIFQSGQRKLKIIRDYGEDSSFAILLLNELMDYSDDGGANSNQDAFDVLSYVTKTINNILAATEGEPVNNQLIEDRDTVFKEAVNEVNADKIKEIAEGLFGEQMSEEELNIFVSDLFQFKQSELSPSRGGKTVDLTALMKEMAEKMLKKKRFSNNWVSQTIAKLSPTNRMFKYWSDKNVLMTPSKIIKFNILGKQKKMSLLDVLQLQDYSVVEDKPYLVSGSQINWTMNTLIHYAYDNELKDKGFLFEEMMQIINGDVLVKSDNRVLDGVNGLFETNKTAMKILYDIGAGTDPFELLHNVEIGKEGSYIHDGKTYYLANNTYNFFDVGENHFQSFGTSYKKNGQEISKQEFQDAWGRSKSNRINIQELYSLASVLANKIGTEKYIKEYAKTSYPNLHIQDKVKIQDLMIRATAGALIQRYYGNFLMPQLITNFVKSDLYNAKLEALKIRDPQQRLSALVKIEDYKNSAYSFAAMLSKQKNAPQVFQDSDAIERELEKIIVAQAESRMKNSSEEEKKKAVKKNLRKAINDLEDSNHKQIGEFYPMANPLKEFIKVAEELKVKIEYLKTPDAGHRQMVNLMSFFRKATLDIHQTINKQYTEKDNFFMQYASTVSNNIVKGNDTYFKNVKWGDIKEKDIVQFNEIVDFETLAYEEYLKLQESIQRMKDKDIPSDKIVAKLVPGPMYYKVWMKDLEEGGFNPEDDVLATFEDNLTLVAEYKAQERLDAFTAETGLDHYERIMYGHVNSFTYPTTNLSSQTVVEDTSAEPVGFTVEDHNGNVHTYSRMNVKELKKGYGLTHIKKLNLMLKQKVGLKPHNAVRVENLFNIVLKTIIKARAISLLGFSWVYSLRNRMSGVMNLGMMVPGSRSTNRINQKTLAAFESNLKQTSSSMNPVIKKIKDQLLYESAAFYGSVDKFMGRFSGMVAFGADYISPEMLQHNLDTNKKWKARSEVLRKFIEDSKDENIEYTVPMLRKVSARLEELYEDLALANPFIGYLHKSDITMPDIAEKLNRDATVVLSLDRLSKYIRFSSIQPIEDPVTGQINIQQLTTEEREAAEEITFRILSNKIQQINQNTQFQYIPGLFLAQFDSTLGGRFFRQFSHYKNSYDHVFWGRLLNLREQMKQFGFSKVMTGKAFEYPIFMSFEQMDNISGGVYFNSLQENEFKPFAKMGAYSLAVLMLGKIVRAGRRLIPYAVASSILGFVIDKIFLTNLSESITSPTMNFATSLAQYVMKFAWDPDEEYYQFDPKTETPEEYYNDKKYRKFVYELFGSIDGEEYLKHKQRIYKSLLQKGFGTGNAALQTNNYITDAAIMKDYYNKMLRENVLESIPFSGVGDQQVASLISSLLLFSIDGNGLDIEAGKFATTVVPGYKLYNNIPLNLPLQSQPTQTSRGFKEGMEQKEKYNSGTTKEKAEVVSDLKKFSKDNKPHKLNKDNIILKNIK